MNRSSRKTNVYYIPVGMTDFQRDLIEILVSLHARSFEKEMSALEDGDHVNGNGASIMYPQISPKQMVYMFDHNIRAVANHPCLLVDHYMPRQFLRMEPTEKLINNSDKFQKLQKLIYNIIHRDRSKYPEVLKIALISHSVRELDLLEGLFLGETVRTKRLSGTSLYDEKHVYIEETSGGNQDMNDSKDGTPSAESGSNSYTGYPRDDYDYSAKRQQRAQKPDVYDWMFLTTTTHLINDPSLLKEYDCDYIISFDPLLDPNLPALLPLSIKANKRIPIIKLLVLNSPDHYILENMLANDEEQYNYLKDSIDYFLRTRHLPDNDDNITFIDFKKVVELLLSGEPLTSVLPDINFSPVDNNVDPFELKLSELRHSDSSLTIDENVFDMKSYQSELMKRTVGRLMQIQNECEENSKALRLKRERETERQNEFDEMKQKVGVKFKKLEGEKKISDDLEKRWERCQTESGKLDKRLKTLHDTRAEVGVLSSLISNEELQNKAVEYEKNIDNLKLEIAEIEAKNEEKNKENDDLRSEYQKKSSLAVETAQQMEHLKETVEQLRKDVLGPVGTIELNSHLAAEKRLIEQLKLLKDKAKFLKSYMNRMSGHYGLKLGANGDASSMPSNNRSAALSSRHKSTRSNTPTYT